MRVAWLVVPFTILAAGCSQDKGAGPGPVDLNHAPVIQPMRDTTAVIGDTLKVLIQASDPDGDQLHFHAITECTWSELQQDLCPHAGFCNPGPVFWFWPRSSDHVRGFTITVEDDHGASATTALSITVLGG
jgi:hypothetical protein